MTFLAKINKIIIIICSAKKEWYHMMFFQIIFAPTKSALFNMPTFFLFSFSNKLHSFVVNRAFLISSFKLWKIRIYHTQY